MVPSPNLICLVQTRNTGFFECERGVFVWERGGRSEAERKEEWNTFLEEVGSRIRCQVCSQANAMEISESWLARGGKDAKQSHNKPTKACQVGMLTKIPSDIEFAAVDHLF